MEEKEIQQEEKNMFDYDHEELIEKVYDDDPDAICEYAQNLFDFCEYYVQDGFLAKVISDYALGLIHPLVKEGNPKAAEIEKSFYKDN